MRPILPGFYPDPTICTVGGEYYLANSSFEYFPGAPLFRSSDLVGWTQVGNILDRRSQFVHGIEGPSTGIYGSTLRHHDGRFWFITTNVSDFGHGQVIVSTDDPANGWSDPVFVPEAVGIDPDLCWEDDGTCYLTWNALNFADGGRGIRQARIDLQSGRLLEPDYAVWQGTGMVAPEGPHLYRIGDYWYLILAEGGTERGHSVTVARSSSPAGPFEPCPWNPVLTHRSIGHPVQNVGHADLVETPDGRWAAVYLGVRPNGSTPGFHVLGRETFLAGIDWVDGWPVFDENRYAGVEVDTSFAEDFSGAALAPVWVSPGGDPAGLVTPQPDGGAVLHSGDGTDSALLCLRVRDLQWMAEARFLDSGRFRIRIDDRHWYGLEWRAGTLTATVRIGDTTSDVARIAVGSTAISLIIASVPAESPAVPFGHGGPDDIVLSYRDETGVHTVTRLDGRYLSTEVAGGFTGRMLALGASGSRSIVRSLRYIPMPGSGSTAPVSAEFAEEGLTRAR